MHVRFFLSHFLGVFDAGSVTRLGGLLHSGQLFKACGNNYFTEIAQILMQFLQWCQKLSFLNNFWATLIDIWPLFTGHTGYRCLFI